MGKIDFSIVNFYAFLIELSFSLLFLVLFASIHYNLTKNNKFKNLLSKKRWFNFIYFFFFGVFLALLTFGVSQLISTTISVQIGLPAVVLGLIFAMSYFYSNSIQIGATLPTIFWVLVQYGGFSTMTSSCWIRLIFVCIFSLLSFGVGFFKEKKWLIFVLGDISLAGIYLVLLIWIGDFDWLTQVIEATGGVLTSILFFTICRSLNKMFSNITTISRKAIYANNHFILPSLINEKFKDFIRINKAKQAYVFTVEVRGTNRPDIINQFSKQLHMSLFKENVMYIKTPNDKFGFIINNENYYLSNLNLSFKGNLFDKRIESDPLYKIENVLNKIPTTYCIGKKKYHIKFKFYVSVYGVHSYELNELLSFNQFMIKNDDWLRENKIVFFNSNMINHITSDNIHYAALTQQIDLNEIDVELELWKLPSNKKNYVCPRFYWTRKLTCDIDYIMSFFDKQTANTLLRHLAIKSIELYERSHFKGINKLVIYYPIDELTSNFFSVNNIINKLKLYGLNSQDIVFCFDCKGITTWPYATLKHIKDFEYHNLEYMLVNVLKISILRTLKPLAIILSNSIERNKKSFKKAIQISQKYKQNLLFAKTK